MSFNLLDNEWLPCLMLDGSPSEFGIYEALARAHEIRDLRDESPLVTATLHRLLFAILHRALDGPCNQTDWFGLWNQVQLNRGRLDEYLNRPCDGGIIRDRFDLFHPTNPFYQVPEVPEEIKPSNISRIAPPLANGGEASALFNHDTENPEFAVEAKVAARWLVAQQATAFGGTIGGGRGSYFDAPMTRGAVQLVQGDNLFRTLMLNLIEYDQQRPFPRSGDDLPAWERAGVLRPIVPKTPVRRAPLGYVDYLTWQSRAILLQPPDSADSTLSICKYFDGETLNPPQPDIDPMMAYRRDDKDKKQPVKPYRLRSDRALWRDCNALFAINQQETENAWRRPRAMDMLATLVSKGDIDRTITLPVTVFGWDSNQAKVQLWRHEQLQLPLVYLAEDSSALIGHLKDALALAEEVANALWSATWCAVKTALKPNSDNSQTSKNDKEAINKHVRSLASDRLYWVQLETPFRQLLRGLPGDESIRDDDVRYAEHRKTQLQLWFKTLKTSARGAYEKTAGNLESSARALRAAVTGEQRLSYQLHKIASEYDLNSDTSTKESVHAEAGT